MIRRIIKINEETVISSSANLSYTRFPATIIPNIKPPLLLIYFPETALFNHRNVFCFHMFNVYEPSLLQIP